jgi:hypothetical protein
MVTDARFMPNTPTQNCLPDYRLLSYADARSHHSLICIFLLPELPPSELNLKFFPHYTNGALIQSSMTGTGYYITIRYI